VQRDGLRNPEADDTTRYDAGLLRCMVEDIEWLALAYFFTDDQSYAEHTADLLRAWFISPETRMNPNFRFAQIIPGRAEVRGTGIIESRHLTRVVDLWSYRSATMGAGIGDAVNFLQSYWMGALWPYKEISVGDVCLPGERPDTPTRCGGFSQYWLRRGPVTPFRRPVGTGTLPSSAWLLARVGMLPTSASGRGPTRSSSSRGSVDMAVRRSP
jgi:hypothetical protein